MIKDAKQSSNQWQQKNSLVFKVKLKSNSYICPTLKKMEPCSAPYDS